MEPDLLQRGSPIKYYHELVQQDSQQEQTKWQTKPDQSDIKNMSGSDLIYWNFGQHFNKTGHGKRESICERCQAIKEEENEGLLSIQTDTVIHPGAVMVHVGDTATAYNAVEGLWGTQWVLTLVAGLSQYPIDVGCALPFGWKTLYDGWPQIWV